MLVGIGMSRGELVPPRAVIRQVRRRWPVEQKRRIVEATYAPGASIAQVAREHGVNANQLHSWRRLCQAGRFEAQSQAATLLPVRMIEEPTRVIAQPAAKPRRGCSAELLQLEASRSPPHSGRGRSPCATDGACCPLAGFQTSPDIQDLRRSRAAAGFNKWSIGVVHTHGL